MLFELKKLFSLSMSHLKIGSIPFCAGCSSTVNSQSGDPSLVPATHDIPCGTLAKRPTTASCATCAQQLLLIQPIEDPINYGSHFGILAEIMVGYAISLQVVAY